MRIVIFFLIGIYFPVMLTAQNGWKKISDASNPVTTYKSPGTYKGSAWVDINNDGNIDLFAMPHFLFLNKGDGGFTKLTGLNINGIPGQEPGGCSWADINNDGFIDFITAQNPTEIYLNNGDNTFQNISDTIPELSGYASWGCALADINGDNKLDLFYAHARGFHPGASQQPCKMFFQDADNFGFKLKTGYYATDFLRPYTVPYFHDYDLDGDMDLFIASGPGGSAGPDYSYRNMKKETGIDTLYAMTSEPWTVQNQDGQCYNFVDYDNDGDLDMFLTNYGGAADRFYKNEGNNTYTSLITPFTNTTPNLANSWGDFDNDGDQDILIASDVTSSKYCKNNGDGTFTQTNFASPIGSNCVISCDYDNDGDLDVFISGADAARALYKNDTVAGTRNWVNFNLKGVVSNTSAIGAIIKIKAVIKGQPVWQMRTVTAQNSFQGQNDLRQHFGLNDAAIVDSLVILWPSGMREVYTNMAVNQFRTIIEGDGTNLALKESKDEMFFKVYPNPSTGSITISVFDEKNYDRNTSVKIFDINGREIYKTRMLDSIQQINLNEGSGTYIIAINIRNKVYFSKVVLVE